MLLVTLVWATQYDLGIRDPDGIIGWRFTFVLMLVGGFVALDVIPRAIVAARTNRTPTWATLIALARERWPWRRIGFVVGAIVGFYATYLSYRNLKSFLPFVTDGSNHDLGLLDFDQAIFFGHAAGDAPARSARHRDLRPDPVGGLPRVPQLRPALARGRADLELPGRGRDLVRHGADAELDAGRAELLPAALDGAGVREAEPLLRPAADRRVGASRHPARAPVRGGRIRTPPTRSRASPHSPPCTLRSSSPPR